MAAGIEKTAEKARIVCECTELWETRERVRVLAKDRDLVRDALKPSLRISIDYLRAWLDTRRQAILEYE